MLLRKKGIPIAEADLETFGEELVRNHVKIVHYVPQCSDEPREKFLSAASHIQKRQPEKFKRCGELIKELGKSLKTLQGKYAEHWEEMTINLNEMIILKQQKDARDQERKIKEYDTMLATLEDQERKIQEYDIMWTTLEECKEHCARWKALALRRMEGDSIEEDET